MFLILISCLLINVTQVFAYDASTLINHVVNSIEKAESLSSKVTPEILSMPGYSSPRVRHFLNNICSLPNTKYMEIGVWQGSTFVSALYDNHDNVSAAIAIDNWSEFAGPKEEFMYHTSKFLKKNVFNFFEIDSFAVSLNSIKNKINVYFYDGDHTFDAQKKAFTYLDSIFEDTFIAIVDDYNWDWVQNATQEAFKELNYKVVYEKYLPSPNNGGQDSWWNGIYVAVIIKN